MTCKRLIDVDVFLSQKIDSSSVTSQFLFTILLSIVIDLADVWDTRNKVREVMQAHGHFTADMHFSPGEIKGIIVLIKILRSRTAISLCKSRW